MKAFIEIEQVQVNEILNPDARLNSSWKKFRCAILTAFGLLATFTVFAAPITPHTSNSYLERLLSFEGRSYSALNCSGYICYAKHHAQCRAAEMWTGCSGDLLVVQEVSSFRGLRLSSLRACDVIDFGGIHVAAYLGSGEFMDSTPERGVARFTAPNLSDSWYSGHVRVLRWRNS